MIDVSLIPVFYHGRPISLYIVRSPFIVMRFITQ